MAGNYGGPQGPYNNTHPSTTTYIPAQQYTFQYKNIYIYICFFRHGIPAQKHARTPRAAWRPPRMTAPELDP